MRKLYFRIIHFRNSLSDWLNAIKENKRLKKEVLELAAYRCSLLQIIIDANEVHDVQGLKEPAFITTKYTGSSVTYKLFNYNPSLLISMRVVIDGDGWNVFDSELYVNKELTQGKLLELKYILTGYITRKTGKKQITNFITQIV